MSMANHRITVKELIEKLSDMPENATLSCVDLCEDWGADSHLFEISFEEDYNDVVLTFDR